MRTLFTVLLTLTVLDFSFSEEAIDPKRAANTIILDDIGAKNLRIETVPVESRTFESTVFAIGRIEETPSSRSVLSSRISGRAVKVNVFTGDSVEAGMTLVEVESRHPGDPPPIIPLKATRGGLVINSHVKVGQPIEPEEDLIDIADRSEMWAIAKIPEKEAALVKKGTKARIRIPALGDKIIEAELKRFGIAADREAGTVEGIFVLPNPNGELQPGMRTEFSIITALRKNVMAVPRTALQGDPSKRVVFVKDFELKHAFVKAPVVTGEQNDRFVEVISGLFPGDEVVTQGSYSLGFAGGGSVSLKEALDAAHGHEHNEDGSEMTPEQKAAKEAEKAGHSNGAASDGKLATPLLVYAGVSTFAWIAFAQLYWRARRSGTGH